MLTEATTKPRLLTIDEVAARLRIHRVSVYRKVWAGELPAIKLASTGRSALRVREDELTDWIRTRPRRGQP